MTTNKVISRALGKTSRKNRNDKKNKKNRKDKKGTTSTRKRYKRNKTNISDLYTYESPVTNNGDSTNSNVNNNVNVVHGLKDYLAVKK